MDLDPGLLEKAKELAEEKYIVIPANAGIHFNGSPIKSFGDDKQG